MRSLKKKHLNYTKLKKQNIQLKNENQYFSNVIKYLEKDKNLKISKKIKKFKKLNP